MFPIPFWELALIPNRLRPFENCSSPLRFRMQTVPRPCWFCHFFHCLLNLSSNGLHKRDCSGLFKDAFFFLEVRPNWISLGEPSNSTFLCCT